MNKYLISAAEIANFAGLEKTHFLNSNARRLNKSLGDLTGLNGLGFHLIEVEPGFESTEKHCHYYEEECVYILSGRGTAVIGAETFAVKEGDFIGYRAGGEAHTLINSGDSILRCIVVGTRLDHDVADYPNLGKRIYRNRGLPWNLVAFGDIDTPDAGRKV